ncbi:hypothetical protein PUMCH_000143 [Australozyma saopauloensis]|uniref:[acyl-carrier-protein] S-malonyltransferase n=1 Tax=Australozyma saopauloensis TaxID=291208 RepID=A0AAX4H4Q8_9ASCO|nr:hypothetical protein PUMCH_000143 [[Candida] saopauloensis]
MVPKALKSIALACPGQGIWPQGCLYHLRKHESLFRDSLDCLDETIGSSFSKFLLDQSSTQNESWNLSTANAQPAILSSTYILLDIFKKLHGIDLASSSSTTHLLGHSLGEYTAITLAKVISLEDGLNLVRRRGLLMEEFAKSTADRKWEMHVLVFRPAAFDLVLRKVTEAGLLACVNNETQLSISGELKRILLLLSDLNTPKKTILKQAVLPVEIPFHNSVLTEVEEELLKVRPVSGSPIKPVVCNIDGVSASEDLLEKTIRATSRPVQWKKSMDHLCSLHTDTVINIGPGSAVDSINSRFKIKNLPMKNEEDMKSLAKLLSGAD